MTAEKEIRDEKRKPLTSDELDAIMEQLLERIYADIGKSIVKKALWILGSMVVAAVTALSATGHINWGGK